MRLRGCFFFHRKGAKNAMLKLRELCGCFFFTAKARRAQSQTSANSASPRLFFIHRKVAKSQRTQSQTSANSASPRLTLFHRKAAKNAKQKLRELRGCFFSPQSRKERKAKPLRTLRLRGCFFLPQSRKVAKNAKPNLCELCVSAVVFFHRKGAKDAKQRA